MQKGVNSDESSSAQPLSGFLTKPIFLTKERNNEKQMH